MKKYILRQKHLLALLMVGGLLSSNSAQAMAALKMVLTKVPTAVGFLGRQMATKATPSASPKGQKVVQEASKGLTTKTVVQTPKINPSSTVNEPAASSLQMQKIPAKRGRPLGSTSKATKELSTKTVEQSPKINSSPTVSEPAASVSQPQVQNIPAKRGRPLGSTSKATKELPTKTVEHSPKTNASSTPKKTKIAPVPETAKMTGVASDKVVQSVKTNLSTSGNDANASSSQPQPQINNLVDTSNVPAGSPSEIGNPNPTDLSTTGNRPDTSSSQPQPQINPPVDSSSVGAGSPSEIVNPNPTDLSTTGNQPDTSSSQPQPQINPPVDSSSVGAGSPSEIVNPNPTDLSTTGNQPDASSLQPQPQINPPVDSSNVGAGSSSEVVNPNPTTSSSTTGNQPDASSLQPQPQNIPPVDSSNVGAGSPSEVVNPNPTTSSSTTVGSQTDSNLLSGASADNDSVFTKGYRYAVDQISSHPVLTAVVVGSLAIGAIYYYYKYYANRPVSEKDSLLKQEEAVIKFTQDLEKAVVEARKELRLGQKGHPMKSSQELFGTIEISPCASKDSACMLGLKLQRDTMLVAYEKTQQEIRKWRASSESTNVPNYEWYNSVYDGKDNEYSVTQYLVKELSRIQQQLKAHAFGKLEDATAKSA
jgi:hypothetical protein